MSGSPQQPQQEQQQRGGYHIQAYNNISNFRSFGANISIARQSISFGDGVSQENMQKVLDILNRRNDEVSSIKAYDNAEDMVLYETTATLADRKISIVAQPNINSRLASQTSSEGEGREAKQQQDHEEETTPQ